MLLKNCFEVWLYRFSSSTHTQTHTQKERKYRVSEVGVVVVAASSSWFEARAPPDSRLRPGPSPYVFRVWVSRIGNRIRVPDVHAPFSPIPLAPTTSLIREVGRENGFSPWRAPETASESWTNRETGNVPFSVIPSKGMFRWIFCERTCLLVTFVYRIYEQFLYYKI